VLNLFDPLVRELSARSVRRVGVFGTRFVVESALFGMANGVEVIQPPRDEVEYIHRTYLELAQTGNGSDIQYRGLTDLALNFCKRDDLDAIVLAGTDLSLIFDETNTPFPSIDCAALHIEAILRKVFHQDLGLVPA
jgi:aspartate racemase